MILRGDCIEKMKELKENLVDAIITDPPYGLEFMGKDWDKFKKGERKSFVGGGGDVTGKTNDAYMRINKTANRPSALKYSQLQEMQQFFQEWAIECLRVLKPGGFLLSFGGTRTYHRLVCGIEDAGFEIRDTIMWLYGSGFPKSLNIGKQIDKMNSQPQPTNEFKQYLRDAKKKANLTSEQIDNKLNPKGSGVFSQHYVGDNSQIEYPTKEKYKILKKLLNLDDSFDYLIDWAEAKREVIGKDGRKANYSMFMGEGNQEWDLTKPATEEAKQWEGWGTALKPACEPIVVARKPLSEKNVALNVLKWGTGGINIEDCRIGTEGGETHKGGTLGTESGIYGKAQGCEQDLIPRGRFPANIILDEKAGKMLDEQSGDCFVSGSAKLGKPHTGGHKQGFLVAPQLSNLSPNDKGGASRFFYCAKASKSERNLGCENLEEQQQDASRKEGNPGGDNPRNRGVHLRKNNHPTVKPIKLMEYLIKLVSKEGATILDPFGGSGTTAIACLKLNRDFILIEKEEEYIKIAKARIKPFMEQTKLTQNSQNVLRA